MGQVGLILLRRTPWQTLWRPHRRPLRQPHHHKREPVNLTVGLSVNLTVRSACASLQTSNSYLFNFRQRKGHVHVKTEKIWRVWKVSHWKFACCCGATPSYKPKCRLHHTFAPLLAGQMFKTCTPLRHEAHAEVKMKKKPHARSILNVEMSKKCMLSWREAHFQVKMLKGRLDPAPCQKWGKCGCRKTDGMRGAFEEALRRCILRGRRSTRDTFIRDVRR